MIVPTLLAEQGRVHAPDRRGQGDVAQHHDGRRGRGLRRRPLPQPRAHPQGGVLQGAGLLPLRRRRQEGHHERRRHPRRPQGQEGLLCQGDIIFPPNDLGKWDPHEVGEGSFISLLGGMLIV